MVQNVLQVQQLTAKDFMNAIQSVIDKVEVLERKVEKYANAQDNPTEYMTIQETKTLLKISKVALWSWTKKGKINSYKISNRVLYKRNEVELLIDNAKR